MYISRSLFENGNVNKDSFLLDVDRKKKEIEEIDFGKIYEAIFTDKDLQGKVKELNGRKLTKADLIKEVQLMDENTMWRQIVGTGYTYIENHFLEIINYRNDVMHNHLMSFEEYEKAKMVMCQAIQELDRAVNDKLIDNNNDYLNDVNIVDVLNGIFKAMGTFAKYVNEASNSEYTANIVKTLSMIGEKFAESLVVQEQDAIENHEQNEESD
ncbi:MAG: hypothetical protein SO101_05065 [Lachnospiraceae bacterium]|nr:hypothetical protein [Lachnospiraceae bacterium]